MTATRVTFFVWALVLTASLGGVTAQRPRTSAVAPSASGPEWPGPPARARIRFVRAITPVAARGKPSLFARLGRLLFGPGDEPTMTQPYGVAVGPDGRVYVADTLGRAVHVYDLDSPNYSSIDVDGDSLVGVGVAKNLLFVTDSASGRLMCLDSRGRSVWTRGPRDGFIRPTGIAVGADRVFVVDTLAHRVVSVSFTGAVLGYIGEHGSGPGQLNFPTNVTQGADGHLYVTDAMNFRIQVFDRNGRYLRAFGRLGDGSGDLDKAKGVAVDSDGQVYVVEGLHDVVQIFDARGALLLTFGESGNGDGQFWLPSGIAIVSDLIYVTDSANRRVEIFEYEKEGR